MAGQRSVPWSWRRARALGLAAMRPQPESAALTSTSAPQAYALPYTPRAGAGPLNFEPKTSIPKADLAADMARFCVR